MTQPKPPPPIRCTHCGRHPSPTRQKHCDNPACPWLRCECRAVINRRTGRHSCDANTEGKCKA